MKVSVIIPCHNAEQWVEAALRSVAAQTHQPHEVIVVSDASTDESVPIIRNTGIATHLLTVDVRNAAAARNAGIAEATGEWIALLDSDDLWLPHHLGEAVRLLSNSDDVAYMGHQAWIDGESAARTDFAPLYPEVRRSLTDHDFLECFKKMYFNHQGVLIRTDVMNEIGGYDPGLRRCHDSDMFLRAVKGRSWTYNPNVASLYRRGRAGALTGNKVLFRYYFLKSLLKNRAEHSGALMDEVIAIASKRAMGEALARGSRDEQRQAWEIARGGLSPGSRLVYRMLLSLPDGASAAVYRARRRPESPERADAGSPNPFGDTPATRREG